MVCLAAASSMCFRQQTNKQMNRRTERHHYHIKPGSCLINNLLIMIIIIIQMPMFMVLLSWQSHCESSPGSFDECRTAPSGRRPSDQALCCESACSGCQSLHPPSPFITITQTKSWYSFYHPTEVEGWVDLVGWLHTEMVYPPIDGHPSWY